MGTERGADGCGEHGHRTVDAGERERAGPERRGLEEEERDRGQAGGGRDGPEPARVHHRTAGPGGRLHDDGRVGRRKGGDRVRAEEGEVGPGGGLEPLRPARVDGQPEGERATPIGADHGHGVQGVVHADVAGGHDRTQERLRQRVARLELPLPDPQRDGSLPGEPDQGRTPRLHLEEPCRGPDGGVGDAGQAGDRRGGRPGRGSALTSAASPAATAATSRTCRESSRVPVSNWRVPERSVAATCSMAGAAARCVNTQMPDRPIATTSAA